MDDNAVPSHWRQKLNDDGSPVADCWVTPAGYAVALCRLSISPFTIIRPGGAAPFAYTDRAADVPILIAVDLQQTLSSEFPDREVLRRGRLEWLKSAGSGKTVEAAPC